MVEAYWKIGEKIVLEEQNGKERADYGKEVIKIASHELTKEFGKGFSPRTLWEIRQFYLYFEDFTIVRTLSAQLTGSHFLRILRVNNEDARKYYLTFNDFSIWQTLSTKLSWSHFQLVMSVSNKEAQLNSTIGILLCTETDKTIVKYSVLADNKQLFTAKYMDYLPSEKELEDEIERQKLILKLNNEQ
jgi:hypothetical protein